MPPCKLPGMAQSSSDEWRGLLLLNLHSAGKLNDEFLPPVEYLLVRDKPYVDWPAALKQKLAPYAAHIIGLAEREDQQRRLSGGAPHG